MDRAEIAGTLPARCRRSLTWLTRSGTRAWHARGRAIAPTSRLVVRVQASASPRRAPRLSHLGSTSPRSAENVAGVKDAQNALARFARYSLDRSQNATIHQKGRNVLAALSLTNPRPSFTTRAVSMCGRPECGCPGWPSRRDATLPARGVVRGPQRTTEMGADPNQGTAFSRNFASGGGRPRPGDCHP